MRRALLLSLALSACDAEAPEDPCPPGFSFGTGRCLFDEAEVVARVSAFDQGGFERINAEPFVEPDLGIRRNVWVTPIPLRNGSGDTAADLYRTLDPWDQETPLDAEFPVGTLIVHEAVDREQGHGVQLKREDGWVAEDGRDWWTGKYFDDGSPDENPCTPCVACHFLPNHEGLRGVPREAL